MSSRTFGGGSRSNMAYNVTGDSSATNASCRRRFVRWVAGLAALLGVLVLASPGGADDLKASGTVRIEQVQIAFIGSGNLGGGTLKFGNKSYDFTIGGLGVGGFRSEERRVGNRRRR